jgi:hypothetical protein
MRYVNSNYRETVFMYQMSEVLGKEEILSPAAGNINGATPMEDNWAVAIKITSAYVL